MFFDVCFKKYGQNDVLSLLSEFSRPANWNDNGYNSATEIIDEVKEYIAELYRCNCFHAIIREDAIITMDGNDVLDVYYGFTPIEEEYTRSSEVFIDEKTLTSLLYHNYGRTNTDEISAIISETIESFVFNGQKCKCEYFYMDPDELWISVSACEGDFDGTLIVDISSNDTITNVVNKINLKMNDFLEA